LDKSQGNAFKTAESIPYIEMKIFSGMEIHYEGLEYLDFYQWHGKA